MHTYAAFLGNQPRLSLAELAACLPDFTLLRLVGKQVAVFTSNAEIGQEDLDRWGGIVLLARGVTAAEVTPQDVPKLLVNETEGVKGKTTFALRAAGLPPRTVRDLYRSCKDALKKAGRGARYVGNERRPAATVLLHDAGLVDGSEGCEMVMLADEGFFWVGKTVAAQDPDSYTQRDMGKPVRDTRTGLLPPKLSQMLLNFGLFLTGKAGDKKAGALTVLDPFCGTGVIPIEALLRGWHVLASDKSEKAVAGCQKNLEWARKIGKVKKTDVKSEVWKQDAVKPFVLKLKPDMIVTETTLGPALKDRATAKDAQTMRSEAEKLEIAFLKNVQASLPGTPVALMLPVWYLRAGPLFLDRVWGALADAGYEAVLPPGIEPEADRTSLVYRRGDQFVGREILLLKPVTK